MLSGDDIKEVKLMLASPEEILEWSKGEVTESETINYRTHKPEKGGLYAEEIFGPEEDYKCACGKYEGKKYEGITCEKCGVLITDSSVRRENMGHIELASPVIHFWFLKGISSPLSKLLNIKKKTLRKIAYYEAEPISQQIYVVVSSESDRIREEEHLHESEFNILADHFDFEVENGVAINEAPEIVADSSGTISLEQKKLQNGEGVTVIEVGEDEYPVASGVFLEVQDGDEVEGGDLIASSPVGEICSQSFFEMLKARYGDAIEGEKAVEDIDSLIFLVTSVKDEEIDLDVGQKISQLEKEAYERLYPGKFSAHTGAKGIKGLLEGLDLDQLSESLSQRLDQETSVTAKRKVSRRLKVVEQLRKSGNKPSYIALEAIPVLPPDLRPIVHLEGGKFATTDLNDLYRRIINRNNRLKRLEEMGAPEVILRNERRMLQESVDALIHNEKKNSPIQGKDDRPLKSLSDRISGKHGRLRRNLLGRRVDYSGRAVIVVNPQLKLWECGVPKKIALELYKPFVTQRLDDTAYSNYNEVKNKALSGEMPEVWDILEDLIKDRPVLLNRAPTLHRLGIEAFEPQLVDGDAIQIHPHVCPPYNADFDGDQMAIHLPLTEEAVQESREIMIASKNLLSPAHGDPLSKPTQDQIYAYYFLTEVDEDGKGKGKYFSSLREAERAHERDVIDIHAPIKIRLNGEIFDTTLGRAKLNQLFPQDLRDYSQRFNTSVMEDKIMETYYRYGNDRVVQLLDDLKELGFSVATQSALTISMKDCLEPPEKGVIIDQALERVNRVNDMFQQGLASEKERTETVIDIWRETVDEVEEVTMENFKSNPFNPLQMMVGSGARGSADQVKQLSGMRGLMADPSGDIIELPVISNFREGLDMMEYFISTHGGRKGTADTALKTADSGYLTRRLVEAVSNIVIREEDCGTRQGIEIYPLRYGGGELMEGVQERVYGKVLAEPVYHPLTEELIAEEGEMVGRELARRLSEMEHRIDSDEEDFEKLLVGTKAVEAIRDPETGETIVRRDETISPFDAGRIAAAGVNETTVRPRIVVRSPVACDTEEGVCQLCYGMDMSKHSLIEKGVAAGIIAAQSVGEPGTQLTMRTFHSGGVAGEDITQGLPRAEELFEARKTTKSAQATIADIDGVVKGIQETERGKRVEMEGDPQVLTVPTALSHPDPGESTDARDLVDFTSPHTGTVRFLEEGTRRVMYLLMTRTDRYYDLPEGVDPVVEAGEGVEVGDELTETFSVDAVKAKRSGRVVEINVDEDFLLIVDEEGNEIEHLLPPIYPDQILVEEEDQVEEGELLTEDVDSMALEADKPGMVAVGEEAIVVYQPEEGRKRIPVSQDMIPAVVDGERVKKGKALFELDLLSDRDVFVESVNEKDEGLTEISYRLREEVEVTHSLAVGHGDKVRSGDQLSKGVIPPHLLLNTAGANRTYEYLLTEIQKVYRSQGVDIKDTHIEVIIAQMLNNVIINDPGDSEFAQNDLMTLEQFNKVVALMRSRNEEIRQIRRETIGLSLGDDLVKNGRLLAEEGDEVTRHLINRALEGGVESLKVVQDGQLEERRIKEYQLPEGERELLRISKSALKTKGWLSAASFQRTTGTLTEAALSGESDQLTGLKPNIIVGKKVPVGTGFEENGQKSSGDIPEEAD
ncbi:MAG: DNA-directed RNA polymerase subunit beta' [Candidatus Bipolaricaulota bacterium]